MINEILLGAKIYRHRKTLLPIFLSVGWRILIIIIVSANSRLSHHPGPAIVTFVLSLFLIGFDISMEPVDENRGKWFGWREYWIGWGIAAIIAVSTYFLFGDSEWYMGPVIIAAVLMNILPLHGLSCMIVLLGRALYEGGRKLLKIPVTNNGESLSASSNSQTIPNPDSFTEVHFQKLMMFHAVIPVLASIHYAHQSRTEASDYVRKRLIELYPGSEDIVQKAITSVDFDVYVSKKLSLNHVIGQFERFTKSDIMLRHFSEKDMRDIFQKILELFKEVVPKDSDYHQDLLCYHNTFTTTMHLYGNNRKA